MKTGVSIFGVIVLLLPLMGSQASHRLSEQEAPGALRTLCASAHKYVSAGQHTPGLRDSLACAEESARRGLHKLAARGWSWAAASELAMLRYRSAAQSYLRARDAARLAGDYSMEAVNSYNLSNVYLHLGSIDSATAALDAALSLRDRAGRALHPVQLAFHQARLTARAEGIAAAAPLFENALELARRPVYASWRPVVDEAYAVELLLAGRLPAAAAHAKEAVRWREQARDAHLSSAYLTLARVRLANNQPAESLTLTQKAFAELKRHKPQRPLYSFYTQRALACAALGKLEQARADLRRAVTHIRALRPEALPSDTFRASSSAGFELVYSALAEVSAALYWQTGGSGALAESWEASAENRAQALRAAALEKSEPPPGYSRILQELQAAELDSLRHADASAESRAAAARLKLSELEIRSRNEIPTPEPITVAATQASLSKGYALVHFQLSERQSLAWVMTADSLDALSLPPAARLREQILQFRAALETESPAAPAGHEIYKSLFGALPPAARNARHWIVVPDTTLFHLPFAALVSGFKDGRPRFLVEEKQISLAHFAGGKPSQATPTGGAWHAFGDPIYNAADPRFRPDFETKPGWHGLGADAPSGSQATLRLPRLPGTAREIAACSRLWPAGKAFTHSGADANFAALRQALRARPEVLHLATHLVPAAQNPDQSRLVLSLDPSGNAEVLDAATVATLDARCAWSS